jgi:pilus assembly protein Flp/PilA
MLMNLMNYVSSKVKNEEGQGMVEYALLIGLIAILLIGAIVIFKDALVDKFTEISDALS